MSGYFDALMRSSGLDIGGRAPATAHGEPGVVEPGAAETDVERSPAAMSLRTTETASTPHQPVASIPGADSIEQPAPQALPAADTGAHEVHAAFAGTEQAHRRAAADAVADSLATSAAAAARSAEASKPAVGQELVRAAMQWVAADAQHVRGAAHVVPPRGRSLPPLGREAGEDTSVMAATQPLPQALRQPLTPPFRERGIDLHAQSLGATPATPAAPDLTAHEFFSAPALPIHSARRTVAVAPVPVAPSSRDLARDEVVEISIGAIHVRVDAPSAQTIARPAPPPAAAARAATTTSRRSALSRRALRRI